VLLEPTGILGPQVAQLGAFITGAIAFFFTVLFTFFSGVEGLPRKGFNLTFFGRSSPSPLSFYVLVYLALWHKTN